MGYYDWLKNKRDSYSEDAKSWYIPRKDALEIHDRIYHGGNYHGGRCSYRERIDEIDSLYGKNESFPVENPIKVDIVRKEEKGFSYNELKEHDPVVLSEIDDSKITDDTTRKELVSIGKCSVEKEYGIEADVDGKILIHMDGMKDTVEVTNGGIEHGLRPYGAKTYGRLGNTQKINARVLTVLGPILKDAVMVGHDEVMESEDRETGASVFVSACMENGHVVPVLIRVNHKESEKNYQISEVHVLKSILAKEKKQGDAVSDLGFTDPDSPASNLPWNSHEPKISVPNLLAICNPYFSEVFSDDVRDRLK